MVLSILTLETVTTIHLQSSLSFQSETVPTEHPLPAPYSPFPGYRHSTSCLPDYFRALGCVESHSTSPCVPCFFHLASCSCGSAMLEPRLEFSSEKSSTECVYQILHVHSPMSGHIGVIFFSFYLHTANHTSVHVFTNSVRAGGVCAM